MCRGVKLSMVLLYYTLSAGIKGALSCLKAFLSCIPNWLVCVAVWFLFGDLGCLSALCPPCLHVLPWLEVSAVSSPLSTSLT